MIEKRNFSKVEYHLFNYHYLLNQYRELQADILEASPLPPDGMPRGSDISDPTGRKASRLADLSRDRGWLEAIEELIDEYKQEGLMHYVNLIRMFYWERRSRIQILTELCCERTTFYEWRRTVVIDLSLKAATKGLVRF